MSVLYIIGNGFDLHHGLPTGFGDFRRYVHAVDRPLARAIGDHLPADEDWSDLEASLAHLDPDELADALSVFLPSYGSEEWSDAGHHDFDLEVQRLTSALSDGLVERFTEWIRQVPRLSRGEAIASKSLLSLQSEARFVTFNYTPTLADVYGVPGSRTWHLHGDALDPASHLILGHGWRPDPVVDGAIWAMPRTEAEEDGREDSRVTHARHYIEDYFQATYKNAEQVLARGADFLGQLWDVTEIYILGHSLADVDLPYFEAIAAQVQPQASVWFSYHELEEREHHAASLIEAGFEDLALTPGTLGSLARY